MKHSQLNSLGISHDRHVTPHISMLEEEKMGNTSEIVSQASNTKKNTVVVLKFRPLILVDIVVAQSGGSRKTRSRLVKAPASSIKR